MDRREAHRDSRFARWRPVVASREPGDHGDSHRYLKASQHAPRHKHRKGELRPQRPHDRPVITDEDQQITVHDRSRLNLPGTTGHWQIQEARAPLAEMINWACSGARTRRASHAVDLRRDRAPLRTAVRPLSYACHLPCGPRRRAPEGRHGGACYGRPRSTCQRRSGLSPAVAPGRRRHG
jgi:hypothetical protein